MNLQLILSIKIQFSKNVEIFFFFFFWLDLFNPLNFYVIHNFQFLTLI